MINSALQLTLVGMSVVFVFLIIMVFSIQLMSCFVKRFLPEKVKAAEASLAVEDNTMIAAIVAAVKNRK